MEYLQWRDVHYYLWMEGALEEELIKHIAAETVLGLQYLHSKGIIYRELKPENLLVTAEGHVKLSDYILSRMEKHNSPTRTYTGNVEYKAPEMLEEARGTRLLIKATPERRTSGSSEFCSTNSSSEPHPSRRTLSTR